MHRAAISGAFSVALFALFVTAVSPARAESRRSQAANTAVDRSSRGEDSPLATLGQSLFFDTTLSSPVGQSCGSCHAPQTGFRFPDSQVNEDFGVASGAINTRFTNRSVPTISYAAFVMEGPPHALGFVGRHQQRGEALFGGGLFWDGRTENLENQARFPFLHPNEMNNLVHNVGEPAMVVEKVMNGEHAELFRQVFGADIFSHPTDEVYTDIVTAIGAYERTSHVSPYTSKFDGYLVGIADLTPEEFDGLCLFTGSSTGRPSGPPFRKAAQCVACHLIGDYAGDGPNVFSDFTYANIGVPRNAKNPFYGQTDAKENPVGYNPDGEDFIDLGLGGFLYPLNDLPPGNIGPGSNGLGDFLAINGTFRVPTLRNVDKRPYEQFVKPYMHNGVFKSLKQVVHFYNTRNLTSEPGEVIDFTQEDPYANLVGTPLWPPPEMLSLDSIENPEGATAEEGAQVGNLQLTDEEEDHLVAFLRTLSDGYLDHAAVIVAGPSDTTACVGGSASFTVSATGDPALNYQWYLGSLPLTEGGRFSGTTSATLTIYPVEAGDAVADYHCKAANAIGTSNSPNAALMVFATGTGDGNGSGTANGRDIQGFVNYLITGGVPSAGYCAYDMNGDGAVSPGDIGLFVAASLNE